MRPQKKLQRLPVPKILPAPDRVSFFIYFQQRDFRRRADTIGHHFVPAFPAKKASTGKHRSTSD
jgi:hypothetical protein